MKKIDFVVVSVIAFVLFICVSDVAVAKTWHVDDDLADYSTANFTKILDAVNTSDKGDTIFVYLGTYYENVNVSKQLILRGIDTGSGKPVVDAGGNGSAITLRADGITLEGFTATNSSSSEDAGIKVTSNNNIISDNNVRNNKYYGIRLSASSNNTVTDNDISNNGYGISLYDSSNNTITGNIVCNNRYRGIGLHKSSNNLITDNTFVNDGLFVGYGSYHNTVEDNIVNGKPLVYLEDASDTVVTDAGQVILINCDNITIENLDLSNTSVGVELWRTEDSIISNNNVSSNNDDGIYLYYSSNNNITGNSVSNNGDDGIHLYYSTNNEITGNTLSNSEGIHLSNSRNNTITGNNVNNGKGIELYYSSSNDITGNTLSNNRYYGIYLRYSSNNNNITSNIVSNNNWRGIWLGLDKSGNNTITDNTFVNDGLFVDYGSYQNTVEDNIVNGKPLVYLEDTSDIKVTDAGQVILVKCSNITVENLDLSNTCVGVQLWRTEDSIISNNNVSSNNVGGIHLFDSSNNNITGNNVSNNHEDGICLYHSSNNNITSNTFVNDGLCVRYSYQNTVEDNIVNGKPLVYLEDTSDSEVTNAGQVILVNCSNITVENLDLSTTSVGVELWKTGDSVITNNNVSSNNVGGIHLYHLCNNNTITGNNVSDNNDGIRLGSSSNNTITGNNVSNNDDYGGICIEMSHNNIIADNNIGNNNVYGIFLWHTSNNKIYLNNFINNTCNVRSYRLTNNIWNSTEKIIYTYKDNQYTNFLGNYWDDYTDVDSEDDGIWDNPYPIDSDKDYHPLKEPFENYVTVSVPEWRKDIEIGDILYARGGSVLRIEGHVGIYIGNNEVVEARVEPFGVVKIPIETWDNFEATTVFLLRVKCPSETRKDAALFAEGQLGKGWRPMWSWFGKHPDEHSEFWYCSELVWAAYYNQGIDIDKDDLPLMTQEEILSNTVSPTDIRYDDNIEQIGGYLIGKEGVRKNIDFIAHSPVDLIVTDPDGFIISKDSIKIPEAVYLEYDFDEDGSPDDFIGIPARKIGNYLITVIPEPDANLTDTYTLEVSTEYITTVLAENVYICDIPAEPYAFEAIVYFDTGPSENPYPSIFGIHNGTIKPNQTITVSTLYTYPCPGTGGHSEYMKIWNDSAEWNVTARWEGYSEDWYNISFDKNFTLEEGETYNYTIRTGSYPQIHHTENLSTPTGFITCSEFIAANGKRYDNWIPAIRLWAG